MTNVLIAVDDSETSVAAARTALDLFGDAASYTVINVGRDELVWGDGSLRYGAVYPLATPGPGMAVGMPLVMPDFGAAEADIPPENPAQDTAEDVAARAGVKNAQIVGESGDPVEVIVAAADEFSADVIVVGSHDRGWFTKLVSPSVAKGVVRRSPVPVLVAR